MVKHLPAIQETGFDPWVGKILEKGMGPHSSTLAWKISWMEEHDRLVHGVASWTQLSDFTFLFLSPLISTKAGSWAHRPEFSPSGTTDVSDQRLCWGGGDGCVQQQPRTTNTSMYKMVFPRSRMGPHPLS